MQELARRRQHRRYPEVAQFDLIFAVKKNVGALDIAMHDLAPVDVHQSLANLPHEPSDPELIDGFLSASQFILFQIRVTHFSRCCAISALKSPFWAYSITLG